ncbi:MAG: HD domain-containing protein, partial [Clostridia bacterium]|nr:HD domain-containing protein [Clostridia bacterium]
GKAFIPSEVLSKQGTLSETEIDIMRAHPQMGYDYLKDSYGLDATSKVVALQHHEKVDGTGYPQHAEGNQIHKYARIVALANVYDSMTSDTPYSKAMPPNEALEYIMATAGSHFDFDLTNIFVRKIIPYPEGTIVSLSNGKIAIIETVVSDYPLRPVVKIFKPGVPVDEFESLDLMKATNITITGVRYEDPNN